MSNIISLTSKTRSPRCVGRQLLAVATSCVMLGLVACQEAEHPVAKEEVSIDAVPVSVLAVVNAADPSFVIQEVIRKTTNKGNVYYDVEGVVASGDELEFDVLMTGDDAEIVETQRDVGFGDLPEDIAAIASEENNQHEPVRIIESVQNDGRIVYEFFTEEGQAAPVFEIMTDGITSKLLDERWKH